MGKLCTANLSCLHQQGDYMIPNQIIGRGFMHTGYPPSEIEYTLPDSGLTIAIILFFIVGPFWLIYRLGEYGAKKSGLLSKRTIKEMD